MARNNRIVPLGLVVLFGILLQAGLAFMDCKDTPYDTAVSFARDYYRLDPDMAKWMCADNLTANDADVVAAHIQQATIDTDARGFGPGLGRYALCGVHTQTEYIDDTEASVHLTGTRRICIHPAFTFVARIFHIGDIYPVDETIRVVQEDGRWKVCGDLFSLNQPS
ncbi:MAG: hypothetical protein JRH15_05690 [Deltaproteobacteria bacterium]|nr:hypothetical protein [Deltaproteobacteria bacterium]